MHWNIAAECISIIILSIIWVYSRRSNLVPSLKNKLFQMCVFLTFCAMGFNILSTVMLTSPGCSFRFPVWAATLVYFAATPLLGMAYFFYTVATVYEDEGNELKVMFWTAWPGAVYLLLVIANPLSGVLFDIDKAGVYHQGPLIFLTYLIFYVYCLAAVVVVLIKWKKVEPAIRRILTAFPLIAVSVIIVQQIWPETILSGSAATCALLIIYLYLQNKQNITDYLTGLPNRQEFLKMVELQIRRGNHFTIMVLSLRGFKRINDTYGQHNGDQFLRKIADYLKDHAQPHSLYRYGGDEFAILFWEKQKDSVEELILTVAKRMRETWAAGKNSCHIQAVIGVVNYPESSDTIEGLVHGIEYAVSQAKKKEQCEIYYCGEEMMKAVHRRAQIVDILEENLRDDSFSVYYQPIISTENDKYLVAESLLRIPDSPIGPLYPNEFIPIAEETGMIVEITYQVLNKVCRFVNRLMEAGIEIEGIHVNFSRQQFSQLELASRVEEIIRRNKTPFTKIKVEITESTLAEDSGVVAEFADRMQKQGVLIELDDFGTGYSNIISVMNTPLDIIKLDKSLIWAAVEKEESAALVQSLAKAFGELGLSVLAEGVETKEQDQFVRSCGINLIQGFLYSKPLPEDQAFEFLASHQGEAV